MHGVWLARFNRAGKMEERAQVSFDYLILLTFIVSITVVTIALIWVIQSFVKIETEAFTQTTAPNTIKEIMGMRG